MIQIKSDEALFNKWKAVAARIGTLKSIVQNDMEVPEQELEEWEMLARDEVHNLGVLIDETLEYVDSFKVAEEASSVATRPGELAAEFDRIMLNHAADVKAKGDEREPR